MMINRPFKALLISASLVSGCAGLRVEKSPPLAEIAPGAWSGYLQASGIGVGVAPLPLWQSVNDPLLSDLVRQAQAANLDIAIATSRVRETRASERAQVAAQGPNVEVGGSATINRQSENGLIPAGRVPGIETEYSLFDAHFDASWEIDFFGRKAARRDVAKAQVQSQEEALRDVQASLIAELCRSYISLRGAQAEKQQLAIIADRQQKLLAAVKLKRRYGEVSDVDVERSAAQLSDYQARQPALETAIRSAIYQLSVLTGHPPDELTGSLIAVVPLPDPASEMTADISSDVLRRRADVRKAERDYIVAARNGDLTALDIYPTFSLFGSAGPTAKSLLDLFSPASLVANLGALVSWPLFDGGRQRAEVAAADERRVQAELVYRRTVLVALEEVETAALRYVEVGHERDKFRTTRAARARVADMEHIRLKGGTGTTTELLTAERDRAEVDLTLAKLRARALLERIALEKALGVSF
jgi:NodT family efflux transporter outer membrane factor (OMF) lipoprotein